MSEEQVWKIESEQFRIELDELGEGLSGDYDPDDPDDAELLRFTVYEKDENGDWQQMDDASYCTLLPVTLSNEHRQRVLDALLMWAEDGASKKTWEWLSWFSEDDLRERDELNEALRGS